VADTYGTLLSSFWTGNTGREMQKRSKDAVILAVFLSANEFANMIGLYELSYPKIERSLITIRTRQSLRKALDVLDELTFAHYDERTEFVWIREMARVRLQLRGLPLKHDDNRRLGAVRLYDKLPLNPFLGPFYDRYCTELTISKRRDGGPFELKRYSEGASQGDSQGDSKGIPFPLRSQQTYQVPGTREQVPDVPSTSKQNDQVPERAAATPPPASAESAETTDEHVELITTLIRKELLSLGLSDVELTDAAKDRCARLRIPYTTRVIEKAIASAHVRESLQSAPMAAAGGRRR
jgi:hypothetical protein